MKLKDYLCASCGKRLNVCECFKKYLDAALEETRTDVNGWTNRDKTFLRSIHVKAD